VKPWESLFNPPCPPTFGAQGLPEGLGIVMDKELLNTLMFGGIDRAEFDKI